MKPNIKKLLILNAPYLLFVYLFDKVGQAVRLSPGADLSGKLLSIGSGFSAAFSNALPSFAPMDLLIGIVGAVVIRLAVYVKGKNAKKYRKGMEYGSARWGNAEDIKPYIDPIFENNVLLTQTERLMMSSRPKHPKYARNKNVLVIGGSGSGKTRFFVKPNLMQMHSSYVVTDPKGTVLIECGKLLQRGGYKIKVLNTINFKKSMRYNPFAYLRSEKDILKLVNTIIANTKGDGEKSGEDFWVKSERLFYCALIGYIWYEAPENEKNFTTLLEMINASEAREDDPEFQSPVDLMFERLEEKDPEHFAVRQYKKFLLSAGKTRSSSVLIPSSVESIGTLAFGRCEFLKQIVLPKSRIADLNCHVFSRCKAAVLATDSDSVSFWAYSTKENSDNFTDFVQTGKLRKYDLELINNGPVYKYTMPARLLGMLGRVLEPIDLSESTIQIFMEYLTKNAKKLVPIAEEFRCPEIIKAAYENGIINSKNEKAIRKLLAESKVPRIAALTDYHCN